MVNIIECEQVMDTWGSDHHPIEIKMETIDTSHTEKTNKISIKKTR